MSYYDSSAWQAVSPAPSWDARSVATPLSVEETGAFTSQIDEVDRALDNLMKSGKFFPARREGMPMLNPSLPHAPATPLDPRMAQPVARPPFASMASDPDIMRSPSSMAGLNGYYASQRFQAGPTAPAQGRASDPEQVVQMKRRLAAARERDLRNYHQEQQFNRSMSPDTSRKVFQPLPTPGLLSDLPAFSAASLGKERVMSPSALSEDERRELISRQHRALYGLNGDPVGPASAAEEQSFLRSSGTPSVSSERLSPRLSFDPFQQSAPQSQQQVQAHQQAQQLKQQQQQQQIQSGSRASGSTSPVGRSRTNSNGTSSPSSRSANFSLFDSTTTQQSNTSASSPEHSPPRVPLVRANTSSAVAPIGTRPIGLNTGLASGLSNTPVSAGAIGTRPNASQFGLGSESDPFSHHLPERTPSAGSNPSVAGEPSLSSITGGNPSSNNNNTTSSASSTPTSSSTNAMAWSSKVWGNKGLGMAASVWG
ncbi:hypothetical protein POJ06DRAFT_238527 [Lipomyces tetrasporus]|uniref:Uncharacterized protein n=1 Tax=Lipomyces tetrasporus TaxID=54092 RepID=A0AAD7QR78_9ASCO|nr:uncharacterized protein POJ06DRAFT_238527 [Lipomyces tetrasporus]KAJ8099766.1 hypothetical protein POJ06DRAFT_238527 [Lipomyces tetrasporus]